MPAQEKLRRSKNNQTRRAMSDETVIDFLRSCNPLVVMLAAQHEYIEHYPEQLRAILSAQGLELKF